MTRDVIALLFKFWNNFLTKNIFKNKIKNILKNLKMIKKIKKIKSFLKKYI